MQVTIPAALAPLLAELVRTVMAAPPEEQATRLRNAITTAAAEASTDTLIDLALAKGYKGV